MTTQPFPGGLLVSEAREDGALLGTAPEPLAELLASWRAVAFGRYVVRFDATWECRESARGRAAILVLGRVMDVERPEREPGAVVDSLADALAASRETFYSALDGLCGAHLVFARDGAGAPFVVQDATGMEPLCYDVSPQPRLLASYPALIANLRGYELSELARHWLSLPAVRAGNFSFPGLRTPYEPLRNLTPNTSLDLDELKVERFFPREPLVELPEEAVVERVAPLLRDQLREVARRHELAVSLTGGIDSRLTLAAMRDVADRATFFTYRMWGNPVHLADDHVAGRLAAALGLRRERYAIARGEPRDPAVAAVWGPTHDGARGAGHLQHALASRFPAGHLHVRSNVLETARGFYLKNGQNHRDRFDARKLSRLFQRRTADRMAPYFKEFCDVTGFTAGKLNYHYTDLFYWEHRLGAWHAGMVRDMKVVCDTWVPYNSRRILEPMLARPLADRAAGSVAWALIDALWPDVLDVPVYSGRKYVTGLPAARRRLAELQAEAAQHELAHGARRVGVQRLQDRVAALERALAEREAELAEARAGRRVRRLLRGQR